MGMKKVEVASTNSREFVKAILSLGAQGATLPDSSGVFKGIVLRTSVEIDEDVLVEQSPIVRVLPIDKKRVELALPGDGLVVPVKEEDSPKPVKKTAVKKSTTDKEVKIEEIKEDGANSSE